MIFFDATDFQRHSLLPIISINHYRLIFGFWYDINNHAASRLTTIYGVLFNTAMFPDTGKEIYTPVARWTYVFYYYNVVLLSKFLTLMTNSIRYLDKLLTNHLLFPGSSTLNTSHSTADLIRSPILSLLLS